MDKNEDFKSISQAVDHVGKRFQAGLLVGLWMERLDKVTAETKQLCRNLDTDKLNWKPAPEIWSVAQVLEHLIKVNSTYFPVLQQLHAGTYRIAWTAKIPFLPKMLGRMVIHSVKPANPRKVRTFAVWEPVRSDFPAGIIDDFVRHQVEVKDHITSSADLLEKGALIGSPANPRIVYSLEDAFEIIVTHEERHLGQMKNILTVMP